MLITLNPISELRKHDKDTGSTLVQVMFLDARITSLQSHFTKHSSDLHSKRGLMMIISKRRKLIKYLKSAHFNDYTRYINFKNIK